MFIYDSIRINLWLSGRMNDESLFAQTMTMTCVDKSQLLVYLGDG